MYCGDTNFLVYINNLIFPDNQQHMCIHETYSVQSKIIQHDHVVIFHQ